MKLPTLFLALCLTASLRADLIHLVSDNRYVSDGIDTLIPTVHKFGPQDKGALWTDDNTDGHLGNVTLGADAYQRSNWIDGSITGVGYGIAQVQNPRFPQFSSGEGVWANASARSHYEITFSVDQAIYFDLTGSLTGNSFFLLSGTGGVFQASNTAANFDGVLGAGIYTLIFDSNSYLETSGPTPAGGLRQDSTFNFAVSYQAVPDQAATGMLIALGLAAVFLRRILVSIRA